MINWMYYPKNKAADKVSMSIVECFKNIAKKIDSQTYTYKSDDVLSIVRPELEKRSFVVEKSKHKTDKISVPVLFGQNGKVEKSFDADAFLESEGYVIEVEAGRAVTNYQFLKDFYEACTMNGVNKLCIAVRNVYKNSNDFDYVCKFIEALYASNRMQLPLDGILIIGY